MNEDIGVQPLFIADTFKGGPAVWRVTRHKAGTSLEVIKSIVYIQFCVGFHVSMVLDRLYGNLLI